MEMSGRPESQLQCTPSGATCCRGLSAGARDPASITVTDQRLVPLKLDVTQEEDVDAAVKACTFWNIIEYWYPYRDIVGESWDSVLAEFIPRIAVAKTSESYQRELMALIAQVHDTHANLSSSLQLRPPVGVCQLPVVVRFVENSTVVSRCAQPGPQCTNPIVPLPVYTTKVRRASDNDRLCLAIL